MRLRSEGLSSSIPGSTKGRETHLTQNQLHELLESEQARLLLENAEDRGFVEPAEIEAFALEHDLSEDEVDQLTRELETIGLEIGQPRVEDPAEQAAALNLKAEELSG